jgi:hypothetical protein
VICRWGLARTTLVENPNKFTADARGLAARPNDRKIKKQKLSNQADYPTKKGGIAAAQPLEGGERKEILL